MKRTILFYGLALVMALGTTACSSCQEEVPPGFVGVLKTKDGIEKELLSPGNHSCWGRDRLIVVEMKEKISFESGMKIRCKDRMNISLDLKVRHRLRRDKDAILQVIKDQGAAIKWGFRDKKDVGALHYKPIAKVYVEHQAREITRIVVSRYQTDQVRENRVKIKAEVQKLLVERLKKAPIEVMEVMISNIDPPKVISDAIEKAKRREVEIQEEKAKQARKELREKNTQKLKLLAEKNQQAMKLLKAKNKLALTKLRKAVVAEQAEAEGLRMRILGKYANRAYFRLRQLDNDEILYRNAKATVVKNRGDKVTPIVGRVQ